MCDLDYRNMDLARMQDMINDRLLTPRDEYPGEPEYDPQSKMDKASLRIWAHDRHGNWHELSTTQTIMIQVSFSNGYYYKNSFDPQGPEIENLIRENQE